MNELTLMRRRLITHVIVCEREPADVTCFYTPRGSITPGIGLFCEILCESGGHADPSLRLASDPLK